MSATKTIGSVLVAGGGIGGIQAALDLANSGYYVYMVEKSPSIGGVMAQLDKTFPTNDCSMCIMSPKLVEVGRHINIELLTLSEVKSISGEAGSFSVELFQKARYVDMDKCIACGACAEKCPKKVEDIYNEKLIRRKAIYALYPQAVPLKYAIDAENCIKLTKDKCGNCEKVCPAGAINYKDRDKMVTLEVGSIVLATGFKAFDPSGKSIYAYDNNPDVVTSLEFERLLSASGPNKGHIVRNSDHSKPKNIAWLQCVGSRDINTCDHSYCSSVCCMYAIKQAIIAKEHDPDLECTIFYMDMRTHGKGFESCYNEAREKHGIKFVRCRIHSVYKNGGAPGQVVVYHNEKTGKNTRELFDIVVLSVGMEVSEGSRALAKTAGISLTPGGFAQTHSFDPVSTSRPGIFVCGALAGPKDIPQTVIEAGSAALSAGTALSGSRNTLTKKIVTPEENDVTGDRPRIGVFVCHCGINISNVVDVKAVTEFAKKLPHVEYAAENLYSCSQDTQDAMTKIIREKNLNRIIVAACTPRTHDPLFQQTLVNAGLNKYLFEMVNIRNHNSWVHKEFPERATEKACDMVRMAVAKVSRFKPLKEATLSINQNALVVGGGLSGMTAAKSLADQGYRVSLVEREETLGGQARYLFETSKGESIRGGLSKLAGQVEQHDNISVYAGAELTSVEGFVGNFKSVVSGREETVNIEHGVTIIASGASELKPAEYLYGEDPRVVTGLELDKKFLEGGDTLSEIKSAVFIQCVGSRCDERPYCSRICCTHSIASAIHLKEKNPSMSIYVLYRDIRTYGERESLYEEAREKGVIFIRFSLEDAPAADKKNGRILISVTDHILQRPVEIDTDLLVLASAVVPNKAEKLAQFFKVPLNEDHFFAEAHVKLAPSDFAVDGVFLCGLAHYPKPVDESIAQAQAAASGAVKLLSRKTISTSGNVAETAPSLCCGCGACVSICVYNAPSIVLDGKGSGKAEINPVLCKGCGACVASCRSGALILHGFEESQLMAMIDNA